MTVKRVHKSMVLTTNVTINVVPVIMMNVAPHVYTRWIVHITDTNKEVIALGITKGLPSKLRYPRVF